MNLDQSCEPHGCFEQSSSWFVYLLACADCSAFKVGFSCNPLQRIYSFSHRYFEQFDLHQSALLPLDACADARAVEAALKIDLAAFATDAPHWVPHEAGGHTEWYCATHFGDAEERLATLLPSHELVRRVSAFEFFRGWLGQFSTSFELWAWDRAQRLCDVRASGRATSRLAESRRSLRNWLDAYRYFDLPLFESDADVRHFIVQVAREM